MRSFGKEVREERGNYELRLKTEDLRLKTEDVALTLHGFGGR
jgi:hypothetical protein